MYEKEKEKFEFLKGMTGCFVAGGAVTSVFTNQPINDYDIYPKNEKAWESAIYWAYDSGYYNVFHSSKALTFSKKEQPNIQIMNFDTFETAKKIFSVFDFTINMGAFDLDTKEFILNDVFLKHCSQRFLSFNKKTRFPYSSAMRVDKYKERGYTIGKAETMKILMAIQALPITSWDQFKEQMGGIYGESIEVPEGVPYSIDEANKALSTLKIGETGNGFASPEELLICLSKTSRNYFINNGKYFIDWEFTGLYEEISKPPLNGKLVTLSDIYPVGSKFYKVVRKKSEGVYRSIHHAQFEYKIGETVTSRDPFIFVTSSKGILNLKKSYNYSHSENVILELETENPHDLIYMNSTDIRLKSAKSTRICPIEEFEGK